MNVMDTALYEIQLNELVFYGILGKLEHILIFVLFRLGEVLASGGDGRWRLFYNLLYSV